MSSNPDASVASEESFPANTTSSAKESQETEDDMLLEYDENDAKDTAATISEEPDTEKEENDVKEVKVERETTRTERDGETLEKELETIEAEKDELQMDTPRAEHTAEPVQVEQNSTYTTCIEKPAETIASESETEDVPAASDGDHIDAETAVETTDGVVEDVGGPPTDGGVPVDPSSSSAESIADKRKTDLKEVRETSLAKDESEHVAECSKVEETTVDAVGKASSVIGDQPADSENEKDAVEGEELSPAFQSNDESSAEELDSEFVASQTKNVMTDVDLDDSSSVAVDGRSQGASSRGDLSEGKVVQATAESAMQDDSDAMEDVALENTDEAVVGSNEASHDDDLVEANAAANTEVSIEDSNYVMGDVPLENTSTAPGEEGSDAVMDVALEGSETASDDPIQHVEDTAANVVRSVSIDEEEVHDTHDNAIAPATADREKEDSMEPPSPSRNFDLPTMELPSLEVCLYGSSPRESETSTQSSMDQDLSENHHLVNDDWEYVRDPGLWKTNHHLINLNQLRKLASQHGIQEEGSHRAVAWRVLLGYLPLDNEGWEPLLEEKREQYKGFVKGLFHNASDCWNGEDLRWKRRLPRGRRLLMPSNQDVSGSSPRSAESKSLNINTKTEGEGDVQNYAISSPVKRQLDKKGLDPHVLAGVMKDMNALHIDQLQESSANAATEDNRELDQPILKETQSQASAQDEAYYADFVDSAKLLDEIRKDVDRTFPDLAFFLDPERNLGRRRYATMERILFVWSKYNRCVKYVQGMNEIVGTIYYVLANDWNAEWACEAEADTYWIFSILMEEMRDVFVPDLDDADTGIQGRIQTLEILLKRHDPEVKEHLDSVGVECSFFAIRWWTTLLTREFLLPDTIRLWDSMFASTHKDNFLCYVCVSMVIMIRDELLKGDFSTCLRTLQSYPSVPMEHLLESSRSLWVYERQITVACRKGGMSLHQALKAVRPPSSIVMAFGFQKGIVAAAPLTRTEKLELASERAAASAREAASAVAASAKGWLGNASRLYNRYKVKRSLSMESNKSSEKGSVDGSVPGNLDSDDDCIYMQAIQDCKTGQFSYK